MASVRALREALKISVASTSFSHGSRSFSWLSGTSRTVTLALTRVFDVVPGLAFVIAVVVALTVTRGGCLRSSAGASVFEDRSWFRVATVNEEHVVGDATACLTLSACVCGDGRVIAQFDRRPYTN